ncbi:unnamed protein product [Meloidogyne enterolobii]|uniref:Uncharacterized protein n=2 Tax=Meloidogyne enterolobii TaxID=390850 RepID=A0A6V7WUU3_MELEN|nr:unnamed protein product [Meloidogyne enterolobii]
MKLTIFVSSFLILLNFSVLLEVSGGKGKEKVESTSETGQNTSSKPKRGIANHQMINLKNMVVYISVKLVKVMAL